VFLPGVGRVFGSLLETCGGEDNALSQALGIMALNLLNAQVIQLGYRNQRNFQVLPLP
jgi:hypothetical protein